jgi:pimeloyl-ACP methyl ester carboxylesterase
MEKIVFVDNLKINLKVVGQGEPVLILHGWGSSIKSWLRVQEFLAEKGFKVVVPDLPGFGESSVPEKAWTVLDYKNFIIRFAEKIGLNQFSLLGHSFGGRISIKFAQKHPEKIKSLILCNSSGIKLELDQKTKIIYSLSRLGNTLFSKRLLSKFRKFVKKIFYFFLRHKDYVKANKIMRKTLKSVINEDLLPALSQIKTRTLIIWGEKDDMVPLKAAYIFKEKIPNSELKVFPNVKHSPHKQIPEKLVETINNFLKRNQL